mmetsp:Transcript_37076/g.119191  ORF Transcript_37076/g.119191 Transcript_37076/m.119191 type:complete len:138 (-) Transcript_37076:956-1369(-)
MLGVSALGVLALRADATDGAPLGVLALDAVATGSSRVLDCSPAVAGSAEPSRGVAVLAAHACRVAAPATFACTAAARGAACRTAGVREASESAGKEADTGLGGREAPAPADAALLAAAGRSDALGEAGACTSILLLM